MKMYAVSEIKKMNRKTAVKAKGKQPYITGKTTTIDDLKKIPNFGDYRPKDWAETESYFVDYDKLIEDVNDNFGISIKSLSELENFEKKHGRILSSEERQFLSVLYGVEDDVDGIATKANLIPVKFPEFAN